uniref:Uncharacterized protein AlNc14C181G8222 n=1 Tax=Albugo laibachii Nc14 TaxID=890382 RepID=F0WP74_9STRA|nr:conserved hypothetical protein [Albugo laibachii Nc14]|eukprot:CCA23120.1 conserved hypothetical protein [Albugo laibachii Nc14]
MTKQRCDFNDHLPTLRLSDDEITQIDEYVAFFTQYAINGLQRQLSPIGMIDAAWKPFKKRQNITLYKKKKKRSNDSNAKRPACPSPSQNESFYSDTAALFAQSALEMTTHRRKAQLGLSNNKNSRAKPFASLGPSSSKDFHRADFELDTLTTSNLTNEISYSRRSCHSPQQSIFELPDFASYDPDTMASGTIPGTLNDFLFGLHASDEIGQKQNNIYLKDGTVDSVLLCKLRGPSTSDPFHFVGIKWLLKNFSTLANPATRLRDFVVLEAVGSKINSNGERFGYYILQSLDIGKVPKFESSGIHRGKLSVCVVAFEKSSTQKQSPNDLHHDRYGTVFSGDMSRSRTTASTAGASNAHEVDAVSGKLQIHCFASYDRKCSAIESASQRYLPEAIFSITNATNCAFMKRLAHAIQRNNVELVSMDMAATRNNDDFSNQVLNSAKKTSNPYLWEENVVPSLPTFRPSVHQQSRGSHCSTCHRTVNLWRVMHKGKVCRLCSQVFCTRCSVDLKMLTQTTSSKGDKSNNIEMHSVRFCLPCVVKVRNLSTWDVAVHSVHEQQQILASIQFCPF